MKSIPRSPVRLSLDRLEDRSMKSASPWEPRLAAPAPGPLANQSAVQASTAKASDTAFICDWDGDLFTIDFATGATTFRGSTKIPLSTDIAISPSGELFSFAVNPDRSSYLYRIDAVNGTATLIAKVTGNEKHPGIASAGFRQDGKLFVTAHDSSSDEVGALYEVNTKTGAATFVTEFVHTPSGDLVFDGSGRMFVTTVQNGLLRFNADLKSYVRVGGGDTADFYGLTYRADGFLYAMAYGDQLWRIDPTSGQMSFVAPITNSEGRLQLTAGASEAFQTATVSGVAWTDANGNGQRDAGEAALAGVTVSLLDKNGRAIAGKTATTNSAGAYAFDGLVPGQYAVQFTKPAGVSFTAQDVGSDASDSDANPTTGRTSAFALASGGSAANVAAGLYKPATVSGMAWADANKDGIRGQGDVGIAGVTVRLLDAFGNQVSSTTTAQNGSYSFSGLKPGDYKVQFVNPTGLKFTKKDQGSDAADSDVYGGKGGGSSWGMSDVRSLSSGASWTNVDAGLYGKGSGKGSGKGR